MVTVLVIIVPATINTSLMLKLMSSTFGSHCTGDYCVIPDENIARIDIIVREDHGGVEAGHGPQEPVHLRSQVKFQHGRGAGPLPL